MAPGQSGWSRRGGARTSQGSQLTPIVSIVIPARDAATTLGAALESVRRQRFGNFECLVVDDGSRDDTRAVAERFSAMDSRFVVVERTGSGLVAALNQGVRAARGEWVARMDADDLMARDRLGAQLARLAADHTLVGVGCHVRMFPRSQLSEGRREYERWLNSMHTTDQVFRERFVECPLAHPTWVLRRSLVLDLEYRDLNAPEDYDLLLRLLASGQRLGVVPRRLLSWRDHAQRLSRVDARYQQSRFTWLKALHLSCSFLSGAERYVLWGYGGTGKALCHALLARGHRPSHIVELHPGRLGQIIQGAEVVPPEALRLAALRKLPLVVSVAGARPRSEIRTALSWLGYDEAEFVCAA